MMEIAALSINVQPSLPHHAMPMLCPSPHGSQQFWCHQFWCHPIPLTTYQDAKENHPTGQQKGTGRYGCDGSCQDLSQCHANGHDDDELQNQHQQFKERTTLSSINLKQ